MDVIGWKDVALAACGLLSLGATAIAGWALVALVGFGSRMTAVEVKSEGFTKAVDEIKVDLKEIRRLLESK